MSSASPVISDDLLSSWVAFTSTRLGLNFSWHPTSLSHSTKRLDLSTSMKALDVESVPAKDPKPCVPTYNIWAPKSSSEERVFALALASASSQNMSAPHYVLFHFVTSWDGAMHICEARVTTSTSCHAVESSRWSFYRPVNPFYRNDSCCPQLTCAADTLLVGCNGRC